MRGLLLKDYLVVKKELLKLLAISTIFVLIGNSFVMMAVMIGIYIPVIVVAYDERAKWDKFANMSPYKTEELIGSKYILGVISIFLITAFILGVDWMKMYLLPEYSFDSKSILLVSAVALIFQAIYLPIMLVMGVEKGRYIFVLLFFGVGALGGLIADPIAAMRFMSSISIPAVYLIGVIANIMSIFITSYIKNKR